MYYLVDSLVLDDVERALRLADEALVVRHDDDAALVQVDGLRQRVDTLDVKVVRRLVLYTKL